MTNVFKCLIILVIFVKCNYKSVNNSIQQCKCQEVDSELMYHEDDEYLYAVDSFLNSNFDVGIIFLNYNNVYSKPLNYTYAKVVDGKVILKPLYNDGVINVTEEYQNRINFAFVDSVLLENKNIAISCATLNDNQQFSIAYFKNQSGAILQLQHIWSDDFNIECENNIIDRRFLLAIHQLKKLSFELNKN